MLQMYGDDCFHLIQARPRTFDRQLEPLDDGPSIDRPSTFELSRPLIFKEDQSAAGTPRSQQSIDYLYLSP